MTIGQMFGQSGMLTLLGMGTVFIFLIILIISVTWIGKIIHALGLDKKEEPVVQKPKASSTAASAADATVTAVVTAAVTEYRKTH